jgi:REP element-mobilizing transposase RayT
MRLTIGYHIVFSAYGLWLPGDERGTWSEAWDEQIGFYEPHMLHPGDPVRKRMSEERMQHPRVVFTDLMIDTVTQAIDDCQKQSDWAIKAAAIEATHTHLLLTYTKRDIDKTAKWLKDQTTKAVHRTCEYSGPVWCKGKWRLFLYEQFHWANTLRYIERHNERRGVGPRPYTFLA